MSNDFLEILLSGLRTELQVLGRGGFGVVLECRNKWDEVHYAVKRITQPGQEENRRKVDIAISSTFLQCCV